ncbi:hypothetical protein [Maribacter sp. 2307UL18-2]|uniref:hypothetical protein n=1 Tax=Maribacter sp. 2307UL18-2 TaxID=3386274 RepID=UPI0039BD0414
MPKLSIQRTSEFENRARKIKIELDGALVCNIKNGEHITLDISSGKQLIQAKIDWCTSNRPELDVDATSHPKIILSSGDGPGLFRFLFKTNEYLKLTKKVQTKP